MQIEQFKGRTGGLSTEYPLNLKIFSLDISRFYKVQRSFVRERGKKREKKGRVIKNSTHLQTSDERERKSNNNNEMTIFMTEVN